MASKVHYAEIRFNDRPIKEQLSDPELTPGLSGFSAKMAASPVLMATII